MSDALKINVPALWDGEGNFLDNAMYSLGITTVVVGVVQKPAQVYPPAQTPTLTPTLQVNTEAFGVLYINQTLAQWQALIRDAEGAGEGGGAPTGPAGGSLTGTYPNPTIATIPSGATATTQTAGDNSTKVATTAFVTAAVGASGITIDTTPITGGTSNGILVQSGTNKVTDNANFNYDGSVFNLASGEQKITRSALVTTPAVGLTIQNTTEASNAVRSQISPSFHLLGTAWNGAASVISGFREYITKASGATNAYPVYNLQYTIDGSAFTGVMVITASATPMVAITGSIFASSSISTNGSLSVGSGNVGIGNGDLQIQGTGKTILMATSVAASALAGTATLVAGTATVSTTALAAGDLIFLTMNTPGGTTGVNYSAPSASIVTGAGGQFVINSVSAAGAVVITDTSTVNWWVIHTQ